MPPVQAQPALRSKVKDMLKGDDAHDFGLLPGTFIKPLGKDMPSPIEQPRERLRMEWLWIKRSVENFFGYVAFFFFGLAELSC